MYVTDLRRDFFDRLSDAERVLVFANFDVDAVCAVKILQTLLKYDHVMFTVVPVQGKTDLLNSFKDHVDEDAGEGAAGSQGVVVVMINCGGTLDLVDFLDPPENLVFYVADSHRPTDVCNVYSDGQVRILTRQEDDEDVPDYDDIFRDSDDEDEEQEEEDDENQDENGRDPEKRARFDESAILKRRERRVWEDRRTKLLFEYQQFSCYGPPTALLMFDLAWKMSRDTNDLLWWAVVGHTEQYFTMKTQTERYVMGNATVRDHVSRLNVGSGGGDANPDAPSTSVDCMKLAFEKELNLNLYRHWSIYESLCHTMYTASKFKIWTLKGKQRLSEFLVEVGLPLAQCKQRFSTMDLELRNDILQVFEEKSDKYGLDDITYGSFVSNYGYRSKFCAADAVYAIVAIMEQHTTSISNQDSTAAGSTGSKSIPEQSFYEAGDALSRSNVTILEEGIKKGRDMLSSVMKQVQNFLDLRLIVSAGPFLYTIIREGTPDSKQFSKPNTLGLLAHFTLRAHVAVTSSKKVQNLPLVISAPLDEAKGTCLVLGVPPVSDRTRKNLLGKAFEQAAKKTNSRYLLDYFDASVIQLRTEDRSKFFDGLISLLS